MTQAYAFALVGCGLRILASVRATDLHRNQTDLAVLLDGEHAHELDEKAGVYFATHASEMSDVLLQDA